MKESHARITNTPMMKEITFQVPQEQAERVRRAVEREVRRDESAWRLELVKVITRTKGHVCNWSDLEREIMKGAL